MASFCLFNMAVYFVKRKRQLKSNSASVNAKLKTYNRFLLLCLSIKSDAIVGLLLLACSLNTRLDFYFGQFAVGLNWRNCSVFVRYCSRHSLFTLSLGSARTFFSFLSTSFLSNEVKFSFFCPFLYRVCRTYCT